MKNRFEPRIGYVVLIRPSEDVVDVAEGERIQPFLEPRFGIVQDVKPYRVTVRVYAPELKPNARRSWEKVAYFHVRPEHCQPAYSQKKIREVHRLFARVDDDCRRDNSGRRR